MIGAASSASTPLWRAIEARAAAPKATLPVKAEQPASVPVRAGPDFVSEFGDQAIRLYRLHYDSTAKPSIRKIIAETAARHGLKADDLTGASRTVIVYQARQEAMIKAAKTWPTAGLPAIGIAFKRDHTTILHAISKHCAATGETVHGVTPEVARARMAGLEARAAVYLANRKAAQRARTRS